MAPPPPPSPILRRSSLALASGVRSVSTGYFNQKSPATPRRSTNQQQQTSPTVQGPSNTNKSLTTLQEANYRNSPEVWISSTANFAASNMSGSRDTGSPNKNKAELGKTLSTLQERLPTILQSPLPNDILANNISLHMFPSTHPHLPQVSGRVLYNAAILSAPVAWNRVPYIGDNKLEILSERMTHQQVHGAANRQGAVGERLVVRWRTIGKSKGLFSSFNGGSDKDSAIPDDGTFTGLFIFEFNKDGKVLSHTIETVTDGGDWERGMGAKFVGLTDWLLGGMKGSQEGGGAPCPAFQWHDPKDRR